MFAYHSVDFIVYLEDPIFTRTSTSPFFNTPIKYTDTSIRDFPFQPKYTYDIGVMTKPISLVVGKLK